MGRFGAAIDRLLARWLRAAAPDGVARPVLDLHGYGVKDALALTERFLADAQREGLPEVEIVYGKGRGSPGGHGVLREVVPRWLATEGRAYVASAVPDTDRWGEDGAMRIRIRRV